MAADNGGHINFVGQGKHVGHDVDSVYDEEEIIKTKESDFKHKQKFKGWTLMWLSYQATGVIYGDIGTSPLYVYSSTFSSNPSHDDLLGALSLIIWALTLIVTVKYVCIVLLADDEGEGGTFAMYNLISRYCNILKLDPKTKNMVKIERYLSNELRPSTRGVRDVLEHSRFIHGLLKVLGVFGVSLIIADGVLTPAQSILGAIQGIEVVSSNLTYHTVVGISCAILVVLFVVQPLGITKISAAWAPIVIIWLLFNFCFGVYNLAKHDWTVLKAFSPYFAGLWFVRNGTGGWKQLGGVLLAFTGVEALFADLGAFSRTAVQISWIGLAYPCLLMAYIGQAAYISDIPSAYANPFFLTVPPGTFWPSLVVSILAAIVASQATITATFQLLVQVMNGSYFPHISKTYTSEKFHGQVYIPAANWLLMIGTIIVTAVYKNTTSLGNAYGVCVILVTFITTFMIALVALIVWRLHWLLVFAVWLPIVTLDGLFMTAVMTKVPNGAWSTLMLAVVLSSIFVLWRYGKEKQWSAEGRDRSDLTAIVLKAKDGEWKLAPEMGGRQLTHIKGISIFFDKAGNMVPTVYEEFLRKFEARAEVEVFLHFRSLIIPHVLEEEKFSVARTSLPNCYRMVVRHGYNDVVVTENLGDLVYSELRKYITQSWLQNAPAIANHSSSVEPSVANSAGTSADDRKVAKRLEVLDQAYAAQTVYIVGKEQLRLLRSTNNIVKWTILNVFLWLRDNTRAKVASMKIPVDKLVEVGFVKEM